MAVNYFTANPDVAAAYQENSYGLSPQEFADAHYSLYGAEEARAAPVVLDLVSQGNLNPTQIAAATGIPVNQVIAQVATTVPQGQATLIGDTWVQPNYQIIGSGMDQQVGGIENISVYKTPGGVNDQIPVGTDVLNYTPTGVLTGTSQIQAVDTSLGGALKDIVSNPGFKIIAAAYGLNAALGAFGAAGATAGMTAAEIASLTAGDLAIGGGAFAGTGLTAAQLGAAGLTASEIAALTAQDLAIGGGGLAGYAPLTAAEIAGLTAADLAIGTGAPTATGLLGGAAGLTAADLAIGGGGAASTLGGATLGGGAATTIGGATLPAAVTSALTNAGVSTAVNSLLGGGRTSIPNLISGGLGTAGNLLQMQESREAAQRAQARIDAETAAAKQSAAFRPIGMTTRFGTSQFQVDPVTGQLTSAGYTLSPEAKAQQDRFMALSQQGLTQAEQAQQQFAPLQTGAQRLFGLGNQYLAQSPEAVAQNYLNQQMALLQPGRELELANLQNRLQQQGRGGLSVAQGGTLGATTPELQALYNARATQEAQLAAQAQQAGQQQVAFGAGLLGQGAQTMGQYYGGQQAAYAPYTTAMGQVQGLEALGQQPLTTGINLGQISSQAGANVGKLGLEGARLSAGLATSADATRNLLAQSLIAGGNPNAQFGSAIGGLLGGGLQSAFSGTGLGSSGFGTGLAYGNQDLGLFL